MVQPRGADVTVVVGGQFGSEAKGATTAYLARQLTASDVVIRVAGPNAGHTAYDADGREWKLRCVPVAAVVNSRVQLHLAAGSEIDLSVLLDELRALDAAGHAATRRLSVHPSATILEEKHLDREGRSGIVNRIGSTGKGIGAARADRINRVAMTWGQYAPQTTENAGVRWAESVMSAPGPFDLSGVGSVIIEGTQGYGLGLHTSNYPQVTSSDCRAIDFLAMAGISPWDSMVARIQIRIVARTFPIRVAGNSGPLLGETTWAELGLPEERTTVTQKVRRVGEWDHALLEEAIRANGGGHWNLDVQLAVTMLDQLFPEVKGMTAQKELPGHVIEWLQDVQDEMETDITLVGTSPTTMFGLAI